MQESDKAVTKTVSLPESLWASLDAHAKDIGEDRSGYFRRLVRADLQSAGKLPGSADAEDLALFIEARRLLGRAPVRAALVALGVQREANASEASAA